MGLDSIGLLHRRDALKFAAVATAGVAAGQVGQRSLGSKESAFLGVNLGPMAPTLYSGAGPIATMEPLAEAYWEAEAERLLDIFESLDESFPVADDEPEVAYQQILGTEAADPTRFESAETNLARQMATASATLLGSDGGNELEVDLVLPGDLGGLPPVLPVDEPTTAGLVGGGEEVAWQIRKRIGSYQIRLSLKKGFLPKCINRDLWYIGVDIQKIVNGRGQRLFNLHVGAWWTWRGPCFGVWESIATGYCRTTCTWNLWKFVASVAAAVLAYKLSGWIVGALANAIAGGVVGGLTLAPGVPPPP